MLCYILYMKDMGEVLEKELIDNLLNKSEEAFLMAIEIYNKPTINYRLEGFTFFICNAWELLLKAKILNDGNSIYFFDKPDRTISLSNCIKNIFTNDKDPVRKNLEIMLGLRKLDGINLDEFKKKFGIELENAYNIKALLKSKELIEKKGYIYINPNYIYVSNEILLKII